MEARELRAHADPKLRIEVRKWLVHQVRGRLAHDRAPHRDALALPTGEVRGPAVEVGLEPEHLRHVADAPLDLRLRRLANLEAVREVLVDRHVRVQRVVLEHHRDVAVARREVRDVTVADEHGALGDVLEAGDHPEERRLAASRRADEHHELARLDRQRDVVHGTNIAGVDLADVLQDDLAHEGAPLADRLEPRIDDASGEGELEPDIVEILEGEVGDAEIPKVLARARPGRRRARRRAIRTGRRHRRRRRRTPSGGPPRPACTPRRRWGTWSPAGRPHATPSGRRRSCSRRRVPRRPRERGSGRSARGSRRRRSGGRGSRRARRTPGERGRARAASRRPRRAAP